jgi:hypothetical protein
MTRRHRQHARRVRYPETVAYVRFSGEHRLPACKSRQLAETVFNGSMNTPNCCRQAAGNCGLVARAPRNGANAKSLRALFERVRLAAQKREGFAGEMEGAGNQDTLAASLRSRDCFGNGRSDGVGE